MRRFLGREVPYELRNHHYSVSQMLLALVYPIVLGLDRIESASFLRFNGTFQYLTGLPGFPDPQTLRRFLLNAPERVWEHLHSANDRLLQNFIHLPTRRSWLILDLDGTVVPVIGKQAGAEVGYNPKYRGKRSYNPLLCLEANSSFLWDAELRPGDNSPWDSSPALLQTCFSILPPEIRFRADAGFGYEPVLRELEDLRPVCGRRSPDVLAQTPVARLILRGRQYPAGSWRKWSIERTAGAMPAALSLHGGSLK